MDRRCSIEGCPGSPKYSSSYNYDEIFCEEHRSAASSVHFTKDFQPSTFAIKEMGKISGLVSEVMRTGKGMFQEICEKLCNITDELAKRQQDLLSIAQNNSPSDQIASEILRLSNVGIKLRNRHEFSKLVDQHFSQSDSTIDFSIFSEDIKAIRDNLGQSNTLIQVAREEAAKDREVRDHLLARMASSEQQTEIMKNDLEHKINDLRWNMQVRAGQLVGRGEADQMHERIRSIEEELKRNEHFFEEVNQKYIIFAHATQSRYEEIKQQELRAAEDVGNLMKRFDLITHELKMNYNNFANLHTQMFNDQERARNEAVRKLNEGMNQEFKAKCDKDKNEFYALGNKVNNEFNTAKGWITSKIEELEKKFSDKVRKEVDLYQEDRKREEIRNEKERLKKIAEENKRKLEEERLAEKRRVAEEKKQKEILRLEEEKRQLELKIQEEEKRKKEEEEKSILDLEKFMNWPLNQKITYFNGLNLENFANINVGYILEIKISNDGDYGFVCIVYSGITKQIVREIKVYMIR